MPVYNRQNYVHHAIQSILDQTFSDWELIIVDDGSTDNTEKVCRLFKDSRIRYYKNAKNSKISFTRNKGNRLARTDWIVVQDSDDMSLPDRLQEFWNYIQENPNVDYIYHDHYCRALDIRYGARAIHREYYKSEDWEKKRALTHPTIPAFACYKKKTVLELPYRKNVGAWDDWMLIMDFTLNDKKFGHIKKPLYEYVISEDSITISSDNDGGREQDQKTIENILRKEYGLNVK